MGSSKGFLSKLYGLRVTVGHVGQPLTNKVVVHRPTSVAPPIVLSGGALSALVPGFIWAFLPDKTTYLGPFLTFSGAYRELNPTFSAVTVLNSHHSIVFKDKCNKDRLTSTERGNFYIVKGEGKVSFPVQMPVNPWSYK
jgi:hypothetical protein